MFWFPGQAVIAASDEHWVARAVDGDRDALVALLERHGPAVERGLRVGPRWRRALDVGDVMQVTYLEAFLRIGTFDPRRASLFAGWLRRIAQNNLRDALRALRAKGAAPRPRPPVLGAKRDFSGGMLDLLAGSTPSPSFAARRREARDVLHAALQRLPHDYAQAVRLYDLEGHTIEQVASLMRRSAGAVHMLRMRAHDRLRELLGSDTRVLESRA